MAALRVAVVWLENAGCLHDPGPPECPTVPAFSDGFESGNLDAWSGSSVMHATLASESSVVHTSHYALEASPSTTTNFVAYALRYFPIQPCGFIAARAWVYAAQPLATYDQVLELLGGSANDGDEINVNVAANDNWEATEFDGSAGFANPSSTPIAPSTWVCLELDVTVTPAASSILFYVADQEVVMAPLRTPTPAYSGFQTGLLGMYGGTAAYIDDVAIAAQHIGCE
jgi:hypothetical protein